MPKEKELVGASTAIMLLGILNQSPGYGYMLVKRMNQESGDMFVWQEGTVYPVLHKLEEEELVRSQWETSDTGRERKYYYITPKGRDALVEKRKQWNEFHGMITKLLEVTNE
jgi:DNA-binding PadR family transcriptional regulator